jgi:hypothetical protein
MTPAGPQPESSVPPAPAPAPDTAPAASPPQPPARWYHKLSAVLFATVCLEIGCYLAVFPWTPATTDFVAFRPEWRQYLDNLFVRGAITGLGLVNLYLAVIEIFRLRRFARR